MKLRKLLSNVDLSVHMHQPNKKKYNKGQNNLFDELQLVDFLTTTHDPIKLGYLSHVGTNQQPSIL